ncbi:unnamed protein product, partial [Laminaria digitata]
ELVVLDLRGNSLVALPSELSRCGKLEFLHVGGNKVTSFGPELCEGLRSLRELYLYRNKIDCLPPEVQW